MALRGQRIVAGDHHGADTHLPEPFEPLADAGFENVFEHDHADELISFSRSRAASPPRLATAFTCSWTCGGGRSAIALEVLQHRVDAPLRMRRPSGRSTPLIRVCAVNATNFEPGGRDGGQVAPGCTAVQFDDALAFRRLVGGAGQRRQPTQLPRRRASPSGRNSVALRFPSVIVPVLSSSSVSMSPATSTALPLLAIRFARNARSIPAMPMRRQQCTDGRRNQADEQCHERRDVGAEALQSVPPEVSRHVLSRRTGPSARGWR